MDQFLITKFCLCASLLFKAAFVRVTLPKANSTHLSLQKYSMSPEMVNMSANFPNLINFSLMALLK